VNLLLTVGCHYKLIGVIKLRNLILNCAGIPPSRVCICTSPGFMRQNTILATCFIILITDFHIACGEDVIARAVRGNSSGATARYHRSGLRTRQARMCSGKTARHTTPASFPLPSGCKTHLRPRSTGVLGSTRMLLSGKGRRKNSLQD